MLMNYIELDRVPDCLKALKKPPARLYYQGDLSLLNKKMISIVGTRRPNQYTKDMTLLLAKRLSSLGCVVVSGAAMGVDALSHKGAFPNTVAVMANSLDIIYPAVNKKLISDLASFSLIFSEYAPTTKATRYSFVHRNRIVVALGEMLIITEADENSGSLRSFEYAKELGKKVYVLSHRVGESRGTQKLIESGEAEIITDVDKFLNQFGKEESVEDELSYLDTPKTLNQALKRYGDRLYEMELEGRVQIKNLTVIRL